MRCSTRTAAAFALAIPLASAQTFTSCNPTQKSCPADPGLPTGAYTVDFTAGAGSNSSFSAAAGTTITYGSNGAVFSIGNAAQAPTIATDFYIFFGRTDIVFKAATGQGIVSSIVLQSDDLDEIDWEFIGGVPGQVQSNYYGKGNTTTYNRVQYHNVADTQNTWHTYSVDWTADRIQYIIDGSVVRTLNYGDALGGQNYPQTPMQLKLGSWAAGASASQGTAEWAGGKPNFDAGPFNMYVKSVSVQNYNPACSYGFGDQSGSWQSIQVVKSGSGCAAGGSSGSSSSSTVSPSATGSSTTSVASTATSAPTHSRSVAPLINTNLAASTTIQGSAYSTNTASIAAVNTGSSGNSTTLSTSGTPKPTTASSTPTPGAASANSIMASGSLLSVVAAFFLL